MIPLFIFIGSPNHSDFLWREMLLEKQSLCQQRRHILASSDPKLASGRQGGRSSAKGHSAMTCAITSWKFSRNTDIPPLRHVPHLSRHLSQLCLEVPQDFWLVDLHVSVRWIHLSWPTVSEVLGRNSCRGFGRSGEQQLNKKLAYRTTHGGCQPTVSLHLSTQLWVWTGMKFQLATGPLSPPRRRTAPRRRRRARSTAPGIERHPLPP